MAYPRTCPLCRADYTIGGAPDLGPLTLEARAGGTSSPRQPAQPGRMLTLRCLPCGESYTWDYFGDAKAQFGQRTNWATPGEACEQGQPRRAVPVHLHRTS